MSTDIAAGAPAAAQRSVRRPWTRDLRTARVVRFAFGLTAAVAVSFGFSWPLYFITPVLAAVFLAMPIPAPTIRQGLDNIVYILVAFVLGLGFTLILLSYPLVYVPALGLVLFHIYFIALMLFTTQLFGLGIFSDKPGARYLPSAVIALVVLIGSSMGEGASITDKFITRVVLLSAATIYVVAVLGALNHFWPQRDPAT